MKNIRDRLNELYSKTDRTEPEDKRDSRIRQELGRLFQNRDKPKYFPKSRIEQNTQSISDLVQGKWINTHFGDIFRAEYRYDLAEPYGNLDMHEIFNMDTQLFEDIFSIDPPISPDCLLFIDTETTGLSGGTGTVAFLIGLGFIEKQIFTVHQYFITQLSHEEGMLDLLQKIIPLFDSLVSYNGKSFDIPLLNSRFVLNRMPPILENIQHIDLLHPTRTFWKYSMENCKLKTVETDLLGLYREDDIPGEMIPDAYFDYLRSRRIDKIERIFYHNRFDIITMLANLILVMKAYQSQEPEENPLTDYAKARMFTRKKDMDRSIAHYEHVLNSKITVSRRQKTNLELALLYKKTGQWKKAQSLWENLLEDRYPFSTEPYIELAKYYEHQLKDFGKALEITAAALDALPDSMKTESEEIQKRMRRLKKRLGLL